MIRSDILFDLALELAEKEGLQVAVKSSAKGSLMSAAIIFFFSLLLGPIGFILGGVLGGVFAFCRSENFRPVIQVIREDISSEEKEELTEKLRTVIGEVGPQDLAGLLLFLNNTPAIKSTVLATIQGAVSSRLT